MCLLLVVFLSFDVDWADGVWASLLSRPRGVAYGRMDMMMDGRTNWPLSVLYS